MSEQKRQLLWTQRDKEEAREAWRYYSPRNTPRSRRLKRVMSFYPGRPR